MDVPPPATSLLMWRLLTLPPATANGTEELTALLAHLRIPSAIRDSRWDGPGAVALLPTDGYGSILTVPDTFASVADWAPMPADAFAEAVEERFGSGSAIDGRPLSREQKGADVDLPPETPRIDGIAWTTTKARDFIEMIGARLDMSFDSIDAGELGNAMRPHGDPQHAFDRGAWALTDGIAVMSAGDEHAAAFVFRRTPVFVRWCAPWAMVDPSRPGQLIGDVLVGDLLVEATAAEQDVTPWVSHFGLDDAAASRLRALFRLGPSPERLDELFGVLGLGDECLLMLRNDLPSDTAVTVLTPRTARQQFVDEIRSEVTKTAPQESDFRRRHPRWWLTISTGGILILAVLAVTGFVAGRPTAFLPGVVALFWIASLVLDRLVKSGFEDMTSLGEPEPED